LEEEVFIGLDVGTAGVRAIAFNKNLKKLSFSYREHRTLSRREDEAEQDPEEIYSNLVLCLRDVSENHRKIQGIGFSSVFHSLLGIDEKGNPLTPLYPFTDTRGKDKVKKIKEKIPDFYRKTGCPPHPIYPAIKILWLKEENASLFKKIKKFVSIKSYILNKLTKNLVEDTSVASGSGLLNIHKLCWEEEILDFLELKKDNLPQLVEATEKLTIKYVPGIERLKGTPIYPGGGDGVLCHLASGLKKNVVSSTVGSSGAIRTATEKPFLHEKESTWCYHFYKNLWIVGGAINNGGIALNWFKDKLYKEEEKKAREKGEDIYKLMEEEAQKSPPGARGLIFLPFLTGERSPNWNPRMRGCLIGLSLHHEKKDIVRSIMEGVMCRMKAIMDIFKPLVGEKPFVVASGGYTKNNLWLRIQADLFNLPINIMAEKEGAAMGAAIVAMFSQGKIKDFKEFEPEIEKSILPCKENVEKYRKVYENHLKAYKCLEKYFSC